jgi:signal peptidase I
METFDKNSFESKSIGRKVKKIYLQFLSEGKEIELSTVGSSMYPFIKGGDVIKVAPVKEADLRIGDIIVVDIEGGIGEAWFCSHRLVKMIQKDGAGLYMTKGDGNAQLFDTPVRFSRIKGQVIETKRNGRRMSFQSGIMARMNARIARFSASHPMLLKCLAPFIRRLVVWFWQK